MAAKTFAKCEASLYIWFLQVVIILGLASLAVWASLRPKAPVFTISNMDFNHTALATTTTNSSLAFNVTISNPNKMAGIFFDELDITLRCRNDSVVRARSIRPGFYLGQKISIDLAVNGSEIGGLCGEVDLRVGLETGVRYKIVWFKTKHRGLAFEDYVESGPADGPMLGTRQMKLT